MKVTDQIGEIIELNGTPQRVVSLVPSISEFLAHAGIGQRLVGVTKFCVHPQYLKKEATQIGGTKKVRISDLKLLSPDLVIANSEENELSDVQNIREFCSVWTSQIKDEKDAFSMMNSLVKVLCLDYDVPSLAERYTSFNSRQQEEKSVLYLIWNNPYMTIGSDTYIHRMLEIAGYVNVCKDSLRYPILPVEKIIELNPAFVFLSSEPFPFKEEHKRAIQDLLPNAKIKLVDGEMFSWYGSRMALALDYFEEDLNREV